MSIGKRVRQLRIAKNMKIADLAEAVGVDAASISRLETGKQKQFNEQSLGKLAHSLGIEIAEFFTSDAENNIIRGHNNNMRKDASRVKTLFRVEILDVSVSAGDGLIQDGDVIDVIHSIEYSKDNALCMFGGRPASQIKVINVRGDSMVPTIEPGDLIFVDISINRFVGDGIYVFVFDGKIHVKRLQMLPDHLLVISDNSIYRDWKITKENEYRFKVFGKVLLSQTQSLKRHN